MNLSTGSAVAACTLATDTAQTRATVARTRRIVPETPEQSWSFEQIYDEYKAPIYNYVYHLIGSREQADDLTQDTFLKAFKALPRMDRSQAIGLALSYRDEHCL